MNMAPKCRFFTAAFMATVMITTSLPVGTVSAGMVSTNQVIEPVPASEGVLAPSDKAASSHESVMPSARERIDAILATSAVREQMVALGVDPMEAEARVASLTEQELAMIAGRLDQLPAGEGIGIGGVLIILFVVFGVAVIVDALGMMNIFPFVCSGFECGGQRVSAYDQELAYPEPSAGPADGYLYEEERAPAYRRERRRYERSDPYSRRREPRYETEQYYEPAPIPRQRNYYEERFGTQRQIR